MFNEILGVVSGLCDRNGVPSPERDADVLPALGEKYDLRGLDTYQLELLIWLDRQVAELGRKLEAIEAERVRLDFNHSIFQRRHLALSSLFDHLKKRPATSDAP